MSSEEVDDKNAVTGGDGGEAPATDGAGGGGGSETITLNVRDQVGCRTRLRVRRRTSVSHRSWMQSMIERKEENGKGTHGNQDFSQTGFAQKFMPLAPGVIDLVIMPPFHSGIRFDPRYCNVRNALRLESLPLRAGWWRKSCSHQSLTCHVRLLLRRGRKPFSKSSEPPKCKRCLRPLPHVVEFKCRVCDSCSMGNELIRGRHPRRSNWTIKIKLIACWNNRVVVFREREREIAYPFITRIAAMPNDE